MYRRDPLLTDLTKCFVLFETLPVWGLVGIIIMLREDHSLVKLKSPSLIFWKSRFCKRVISVIT